MVQCFVEQNEDYEENNNIRLLNSMKEKVIFYFKGSKTRFSQNTNNKVKSLSGKNPIFIYYIHLLSIT